MFNYENILRLFNHIDDLKIKKGFMSKEAVTPFLIEQSQEVAFKTKVIEKTTFLFKQNSNQRLESNQ